MIASWKSGKLQYSPNTSLHLLERQHSYLTSPRLHSLQDASHGGA